eukprot:331027-Chlamydomonas_euryale.AAC.6
MPQRAIHPCYLPYSAASDVVCNWFWQNATHRPLENKLLPNKSFPLEVDWVAPSCAVAAAGWPPGWRSSGMDNGWMDGWITGRMDACVCMCVQP